MHPLFEAQLQTDTELYELICRCISANDYSEFDNFLEHLRENDPYLNTDSTASPGMKYYMPFHSAVFKKVKDAYVTAITNNSLPLINVTHIEIDSERNSLGFASYGSPQDVLYGFTSERYKAWGTSLTRLFFQSGSMSGTGSMYVTTAPRYLKLDQPSMVIEEVEGAIPIEFWDTQAVLHRSMGRQLLEDLTHLIECEDGDLFPRTYNRAALSRVQAFLVRAKEAENFDPILLVRVNCVLGNLARYFDAGDNYRTSPFKVANDHNQEQIAMKYADEGKYIQKILKGRKVEHVQSNVKMVVNPLRGNKCEVDAIYRVLGQKEVILLEAKGNNSISVGQLYQIYETFHIRLPKDWKITVIALLLSASSDNTIRTIVDAVEVEFDKSVFGNVAASMHSISVKNHYQWRIKYAS